jgi:hypothetical protein
MALHMSAPEEISKRKLAKQGRTHPHASVPRVGLRSYGVPVKSAAVLVDGCGGLRHCVPVELWLATRLPHYQSPSIILPQLRARPPLLACSRMAA